MVSSREDLAEEVEVHILLLLLFLRLLLLHLSSRAGTGTAAASAERLELREPRVDQVWHRLPLEFLHDQRNFFAVELDPASLQDRFDVLSSGLLLPSASRHCVRGNVFHSHGGLADL